MLFLLLQSQQVVLCLVRQAQQTPSQQSLTKLLAAHLFLNHHQQKHLSIVSRKDHYQYYWLPVKQTHKLQPQLKYQVSVAF